MILNVVLKMILRSWWRNKVFFLVSVASLALGLACTNLLMTYFVHEHGLEGRNPDRDRMFFLRQDDPMTEGKRVAFAGAEIPPQLKQSYAEVEDFLRVGKLDSDDIGSMLKLKKTLSDRLKSVLSISADVKLVEPNSITRSEGKSKRVIDKRVLV